MAFAVLAELDAQTGQDLKSTALSKLRRSEEPPRLRSLSAAGKAIEKF